MNASFKSNGIFEIAKKYYIYSSVVNYEEIDDKDILNFKSEYLKYAYKRDDVLESHLKENKVAFRTFIPYNRNLGYTLSQVSWYFDEVVIPDPLAPLLNALDLHNPFQFHIDKIDVYEIIQFLKKFSDSLKEGFLLMSSKNTFPDSVKT